MGDGGVGLCPLNTFFFLDKKEEAICAESDGERGGSVLEGTSRGSCPGRSLFWGSPGGNQSRG